MLLYSYPDSLKKWKLAALFPFLLLYTVCVAQHETFTPAPVSEPVLKEWEGRHQIRYEAGLSGLPSANRKDYKDLYEERWNNIREKFDKKEIYTDPVAQKYLDALVQEITASNPILNGQPFSCYFSRSGVPNASYMGEGVILFHIGLFKRLDNESQAAFVLCHEIAHYYLQHSEKSIEQYVSRLNSDEVQQQLKKIKRSEYQKRTQLEHLVKGLTFDSRRHSRDHESDADSMGVELMHHTRFSVAEALTTLALLDKVDQDDLPTAARLQEQFHSAEYPFQKKWLAREEGLLGGHVHLSTDEPMADSLKTHPDCSTRIRLLQPLAARYASAAPTKDVVNAQTFALLKHRFAYEIAAYSYEAQNYTRSLYYTLELFQAHPDDPYLITLTGKILNAMYAAQKQHTLSKVTDLPSPYQTESYNQLLQFVQNLYRDDLAFLAYYFLKHKETFCAAYEPFQAVYELSKQNASI
jgi:Zn-dependent protease with chaperone function